MSERPKTTLDQTKGGFRLTGTGPEALRRGLIALAVGLLAFGAMGLHDGATRFMHAYLVAFTYFLTLSLGGLFFVMVHHLTGARWSIVLRRLAESLAVLFPLLFVLFLPILGWLSSLYPWADPHAVLADQVLQKKTIWLNPPFFILRAFIYFSVWTALALRLYHLSLRLDETGDPELLLSLRRLSAPGMLIFAVTITFAAFDWLMSLDAHWYSTIYGVYLFAGAAIAIYAVLILVALALDAAGQLGDSVTVEHFHDLGKLLFAFVIFWAYIAFSQMMLIWMGNIPEETAWYARRWHPFAWKAVCLFLIVCHFLLPFLGLLPRTVKRFTPLLGLIAGWMLVAHAVDLAWLILPAQAPGADLPRVSDVALFLGMGCLYFTVYISVLQRRPLIPLGDPRLAESIAFENA